MKMLDNLANEMIVTNLTEMTLRVSASLLGLQNLRVAVLGENSLPRFANEVLLSSNHPSFSIDLYDRAATNYIKAYSQFDPRCYDCFIVMGKTPQEEGEIRALLNGVPLGVANRKLLLEWNKFPAVVLSVLGQVDPLPTCLNYQKLFSIAAAVYLADDNTNIIECGVYTGGTTVFIGLLLNAFGKRNQVYALDTFQGLPAPIAEDISGGNHYPAGFFSETSLEGVTALYRGYGLQDRITPLQGLVGDTLPPLLAKLREPIGFALIDLDQYRGIYDAVHALLSREGRIFAIIDDTSIPGVDRGIRESCGGVPVHRTSIGFNLDVLSLVKPVQTGSLQLGVDKLTNSSAASTIGGGQFSGSAFHSAKA